MPSYVVTGVNRGIGYAFLQNLSSNPANIIVGLVRNVADTEAKIAQWKTPNIHLVPFDLHDPESLQRAAAATAKITSGSLDWLIANAGLIPEWSSYDPLSVLGRDTARLTQELNECFSTNVVGQVHLFNAFMPLILKGEVKKVLTLSSGLADPDLAAKYKLYEGAPYSISKAAMNMVTSKYQAEFADEGVLFLGICPGPVNTGQYEHITEEDRKKLMHRAEKFEAYAPGNKGLSEPDDAVKDVLRVANNASLANGDGGAYLSHFGTKRWL